MRSLLLGVLLLAGACASTPPTGEVTLKPLWTLEGLASPESIALSADRSFFYVSNVSGEGDAKDANGFIAKVSRSGKLLDRQWAKGLDAPKGLALQGARLFVTDIDRIAELDARSGAVLKTHPVEGAKFLNDAAIAPNGAVLASDSGTGRIYALKGGKAEVWLEAPQLRAINGLLPEKNRLVVSTMAGLLLAVDWKTKAITQLAGDLANADGIAPLGAGHYLVSEWPGRLFHVTPDGANRTVSDSREAKTYINDILLVGSVLVVPNWEPGTVTAYAVER